MAYVDYTDLVVRCPRKAVKFNHSLTLLDFQKINISGIGGPIDMEQRGCELIIHDLYHGLYIITTLWGMDVQESDVDDFRCQQAMLASVRKLHLNWY